MSVIGVSLLFLLFAAILCARKRYVAGAISAIVGLLCLIYLGSLKQFAAGLGADSFIELEGVRWLSDAVFFITTLPIRPLHIKTLAVFLPAWFALFAAAWWFFARARVRRFHKHFAALVVAGLGAQALLGARYVYDNYSENSGRFTSLEAKYINRHDGPARHASPLDLYVYIGESSAAMHWGLYGYPRDTTPRLSRLAARDPGLIVYKDVFATHTHSTPALLKSFSLPLQTAAAAPSEIELGEDSIYTIWTTPYKRLSLLALLSAADIETFWITNKPIGGSYNLVYPLIAAKANKRIWSEKVTLTNMERGAEVFDHVFFAEQLRRLPAADKSRAVFLHSHAGHGPYESALPDAFTAPVDGLIGELGLRAVAGEAMAEYQNHIDAYDSAQRYIDYSIASVIDGFVRASEKPAVFIYFSDHGESPATARGHTSSRYTFDMVRVPFLAYFNAAARKQYPRLFNELAADAAAGEPRAISALPLLVAQLFGVESERVRLPEFSRLDGAQLARGNLAILARNTWRDRSASTVAAFSATPDLLGDAGLPFVALINDSATEAYRAAKLKKEFAIADEICYHRANTFYKMTRGLAAAGCVEIDVVVEEDDIYVYHPPRGNKTNMTLDVVLAALQSADRSHALWIDGKNIDRPAACERLRGKLSPGGAGKPDTLGAVLVEFPSHTDFTDPRVLSCANQLKTAGMFTSFYIPTGAGLSCMKSAGADCAAFTETVADATTSGMFTDLSFDFRLYDLVKNTVATQNPPRELRLNHWGATAADLGKAAGSAPTPRMVILRTDDPNNL